ncbi:MAG: hypothetical protein PHY93_06065, partial [Bacteriovorax sp.]|nr:hypothetical protein [Bacteriovorax sp.]
MKTSQIIKTLALLIIGGLIGSRFQHKLDQKPESPKLPSVYSNNSLKTINSRPGFSRKKKEKSILFLILDQNVVDRNGKTKEVIEKLFSTSSVPFFLDISEESSLVVSKEAGIVSKFNMGMVDSTWFAKLATKNTKFEPILTASPKSDQECYSEIQVITKQNSNIQTIEDLDQKNIALTRIAMPLSLLTFKELKSRNITIDQLQLYNNQDWGVASLNSGKVDALVERVDVYSNNEIIGRFGTIKNGTYAAFPNFKIITTTNYKIP